MHKVRNDVLRDSFTYPDLLGVGIASSISLFIVALLVFFESSPVIGSLLLLLDLGATFYFTRKYNKYKNKINSFENQPLPTEAVDNFYLWEEGDEIEVPHGTASTSKISGKFKGVKDDGSIVVNVGDRRSYRSYRGPKETISGQKIPSPSYYEIPPMLFKLTNYRNKSLRDRKRRKLEEKSEEELSNSVLNKAFKEAKGELKNKDNKSKKPQAPSDLVLKEGETP